MKTRLILMLLVAIFGNATAETGKKLVESSGIKGGLVVYVDGEPGAVIDDWTTAVFGCPVQSSVIRSSICLIEDS